MAKDNFSIDRLSDRIGSLVPDFIQADAPVFEKFLKAYFEFLEAEILTVESQGELDEILLEDDLGYLLVEPATVKSAPDAETSRLLHEQSKGPFQVGEYIVGSRTGTVAKILVINSDKFYLETIHGTGFDEGETVTSRQGSQTAKVKSFKHNTILANNQLLDYSNVDNTTEEFLDYFQKDFIPSLDLDETKDPRLTIKNINDLYQTKGTKQSLEFLLRLLYGQDAEVRYPLDETIQVSESGYNDQRRIAIVMDDLNTLPSATDKIIQYEEDGIKIKAEAIIENVYTIDAAAAQFSLEITNNHFGTFQDEWPCTFVDRDGVTKVTGRVKGILSDFDETQSSIYVAQEDGDSILLESKQLTGNITTSTSSTALVGASSKFLSELKVGDTISYKVSNTKYTNVIATITDDVTATLTASGSAAASNADYFNDTVSGGLLNEHQSFGSMYSLNDRLHFQGGKSGRDEVLSKGVIDGLRRGGVDKVYVETAGTGYNGGDIVVFDNTNADGNAAEGVLGAMEDTIILENRTEWGQFEITATAGQTVFNGVDDNGQRILFNDNSVEVYVNGVKKTPYTDYTFKNDRVTFTSGQTAGHVVEIYTDYNHLLMEGGERIQLNTTESYIRNVEVTSPGSGYTSLPQVFPGGYIYFSDITGYQVGETVTGSTSSATATIVRLDTKNKRLIVKRTHTDVNVFTAAGEVITGGTSGTASTATQCKVASGTGAKLLAYSDEIGGVGSLNIQEQGYNFKEDPVIDATSYFKMLVSTPTASLLKDLTFTGRITGSTGRVVSYDSNKQVLTFDTLDGHFLDNEQVLYNSTDTFTCLKFNPFQARGKLGGEGIIQKQLVTTESTLDESASNLHDGKFYQSHSYVVKVGESINKYRSIVKDLVHPTGHIFFGEVAVKEFVNPHDEVTNEIGLERTTRFNFIPTIIIKGTPTYHIDLEGDESIYRDDESNIIYEDGYHMILEEAPDINAITSLETLLMLYTNATDEPALTPLVVYMPTDLTGYGGGLAATEAGHVNLISIKSLANASVRQRTRQDTNPQHVRLTVEVENNGSQNVFKINGVRNKHIRLEEGKTYWFNNYGSNNSHTLRFSTTSDGTHNSGSEFSTGVVVGDEYVTYTPTSSHPKLYYYCEAHSGMGGEVTHYTGANLDTALVIDNVNNPSHSPYERRSDLYRTASDGIVIPVVAMEEEFIVMEDGFSKCIIEDTTYFLREEAVEGDGMGATFITEDGFHMELESGSYTSEDVEYLGSERLPNSSNFTLEIDLEDGGRVLDERTEGQSITSYVPFGSTIGDLNKISEQQTFDISYYLLDEDVSNDAEEDRIVLEDGYGDILLESSNHSGLTISDMDSFLPNFRMKSFDLKENRRTHIGYSSYVKSSNITNSTLGSL